MTPNFAISAIAARLIRRRWFGAETRQTDRKTLLLEREEKEQAIFEDRAADGKSVLLIAIFFFRIDERRSGRKSFVADVKVGRTVEVVASGFEREVNGATRIAAGFGSGLRLHRELVDRVDRQHDARDTGNAALIDRRNVVPEIVVVHAVDLPVDLVRAGAVE